NLFTRLNTLHLLFLLLIMLLANQWSTKRAPDASDFLSHSNIQAYLRASFPPGSVSLGAAPGDLLQAGLRVPYSGLFQLTQLARRGVVSDRDLVAQIWSQRFAVILLNFDVERERDPYTLGFYLTDPALTAVRCQYELQVN